MTQYRVTIEHDPDTQNPFNCSSWDFHSFTDTNPLQFVYDVELMARSFLLSYFEHGNCLWSLSGEGIPCQWDTVNSAGILIAPTAHEANTDTARAILKEYTDWCNGESYWYSIEAEVEVCAHCHDTEWEVVDSCCGFIGSEYIISVIKEQLTLILDENDTVEIPEGWEDAFDDFNAAVAE